jgi:hypothetical protein
MPGKVYARIFDATVPTAYVHAPEQPTMVGQLPALYKSLRASFRALNKILVIVIVSRQIIKLAVKTVALVGALMGYVSSGWGATNSYWPPTADSHL